MTKAVLGGGLSGLSAAYYLLKMFPNQAITLIESSSRLGGWVKSTILDDGIVFEQGPRTIRPNGKSGVNTLALIDELRLTNNVIPILRSHPAAQNRMIYVNGELHSLPASLLGIFKKQPPFSKALVMYLLRDLYAAKKPVEDESIYDFVNRRFGQELADYLISPLLCGICAGNSKEISVKFLMKNLFEYEQTYGSISRGIVSNLFNKQEKIVLKGSSLRSRKERWSVYSLENGLETLTRSLEAHIKESNVDIQFEAKCNRLETSDRGITLYFENGKHLKCNHVVSSIPAHKLAEILQNQHPKLSERLHNIRNVTVGVVNLRYNENLLPKEGFGFLVPPKENLPILGVIYDSCRFLKTRDTVLTVMMGGYWFERLFGNDPQEDVLLRTAKEQLKNILGIFVDPTEFKVNILRECIPQYVVGHEKNLEAINRYISENKLPISLCGASYYGVGVNDVILGAKNATENL